MPRHCVEPGAVILHAAPLTVTKITPTPTKLQIKIMLKTTNSMETRFFSVDI